MNKFRLFATLLVVALCTTAIFTSCSNDDDNPLVGTTWVFEAEDGNWTNTITFTFSTANSGVAQSIEIYDGETETINGTFTYTFNDPIIAITLSYSGGTQVFTGQVRGSVMTLLNVEFGDELVFNRR
jgi:hypothetical protein